MSETYTVEALLRVAGADQFAGAFDNAAKSVQTFTEKNKATFESFKKVGTVVTTAGVAVAGGLGFAVKKAAGFESAMSQVAAISGATGKDFELLSSKAREMGSKTSFSASEAAEGLQYMALAGWDTQQMLGGIEPILHLAEAGAIDLGRASDLVTDSMAAMGLEVGDLEGYLDKVAQTSRKANTDIDALMEAYVISGGTFANLNVPLEESAALLGLLANRGFKGAEAGTAMNAIVTNLTSGAGQAGKALKEMGVSAFDNKGNFKGLENVLEEVRGKLEGMTEEERNRYISMIAGKEHMKTFNALLNGMGEEYQDLKGDITDSNGALKEMRDVMKDNLQGALENLNSAFEEMMISIGSTLMPVIKDFTELLQKMADWFNGLSDETKEFIAKFAAIAAVAGVVIGPLMLLVGFIPQLVAGFKTIITVVKTAGLIFKGLGAIIGFLTTPIGLIVAAAIVAVVLIIKYWDPIKEFFINLWEKIKEISIKVWDYAKEKWGSTVEWLKEKWNTIKEFFVELWESVKTTAIDLWEGVKEKWNNTIESIKSTWNAVKEFFVELWDGIKSTALNIWDGVVSAFTTAYDNILTTFEPLITFFSDTWENIVEIGSSVFERLVEFLSNTWENIKGIAESAWEIIKNVILGPILLLIDLVTGDFEGFKENLKAIWDNISTAAGEIWENIKEIIINYATMVWENAKEIFFGLVDTITGAFESVKETLGNIWENIKTMIDEQLLSWEEAFNNGMDAIYNILIIAWEFIDNLWREALSWILGDSVNNFEEIKHAIEDAMEAVWNIIDVVWTFISETFSNAVGFIMALVRGDFTTMKDFIDQQMSLTKETLGVIWENIKIIFKKVLIVVWEIVKEKFAQVKQWAIDKINEMKDKTGQAWELAKNIAKEKLINMWKDVKQKFDDIKNSAKEKMDQAKKNIEDAWGKAVKFLKDIDLKKIGKDVINGFIKGIKSKVEDVKAAAKDAADAVTGKIKSILKIASPSKVLERFGIWTGEGFVGGILGMVKHAAKAADKLALAAMPDIKPVDIAGHVASINRMAGAQMQNNVTSELSVFRQPIIVNIYDNKEAVRAYVNEHNAIDAQIRRF